MFQPSVDWNPKQEKLRAIIRKPEHFNEAINLCLELHALAHESSVSGASGKTLADEVCDGLREFDYCHMPTAKDVTIAWNLWHLARIEDITMNLLVGGGNGNGNSGSGTGSSGSNGSGQVLDAEWSKALRTKVTDTGNAMTDDEIIALSNELDKAKLLEYRRAVGVRSREILSSLQPADMKRKFSEERIAQIVAQGCLVDHPESIWLKDFWGKKDVAGILLMPLTRHQAMHLNDCLKLKKKCLKAKDNIIGIEQL